MTITLKINALQKVSCAKSSTTSDPANNRNGSEWFSGSLKIFEEMHQAHATDP